MTTEGASDWFTSLDCDERKQLLAFLHELRIKLADNGTGILNERLLCRLLRGLENDHLAAKTRPT